MRKRRRNDEDSGMKMREKNFPSTRKEAKTEHHEKQDIKRSSITLRIGLEVTLFLRSFMSETTVCGRISRLVLFSLTLIPSRGLTCQTIYSPQSAILM
jgi:hypothetical protein